MPVEAEKGTRPRIQSVARAANILAAVAESQSGLSTREISERVGIRQATTYHLLHTLCAADLLRRDHATSNYVMGFGITALASGFARQVPAPEHLYKCVREVAAATGEAVYGSGWADGAIVVLARAPGRKPVSVASVPLGMATNAFARASGKLLLAYASPEAREAYLERDPVVRLTPNTLEKRDLLDQLDEVARRGYAVEEEEFAEGICCVAAPYAVGETIYSIVVSAPTDRFHASLNDLLEALERVIRDNGGLQALKSISPP